MPETKKVRVGIVGAAGYTGGEMLRLLLRHPNVEIVFANSRSQAGKHVHTIHRDLLGDTELTFSSDLSQDVDVYFLCVGHGEAKVFLQENEIAPSIKIVDLSQDFRLKDKSAQGDRQFVYGLPELSTTAIQSASNIANPGCFATAIQLGLLPLAKAGLLGSVYTTGITGSTGAGQGLAATSHFSWRSNNIQAYKTLQHQHIKEIHQSLHGLQTGGAADVYFVPWRGDFARGIYISSTFDCNLSLEEATQLYKEYYADAAFTHVSDTPIDLKQVVNTNKAVISLEKVEDKLVVHSAIDNLLKGASGQAVQNMNLMLGLPETAGLNLKALSF